MKKKYALSLLVAFSMLFSLSVKAQDYGDGPADATAASSNDKLQMLQQLGVAITHPDAGNAAGQDDENRPVGTHISGTNWVEDVVGFTTYRSLWGLWNSHGGDPYRTIPLYDDPNGAKKDKYGYLYRVNPGYTKLDISKMADGTPITTKAQWQIKREQIWNAVQDELWGRIPDAARDIKVTWTVARATTTTNITYTIVGNFDLSSYPEVRNPPRINAVITIPLSLATKPVPIMINGTNGTTANGWGSCNYTSGNIQPANAAGMTGGIIGLVNKGKWRKPNDWGAQVAWSFGVTKLIDLFEGKETDVTITGTDITGTNVSFTNFIDPVLGFNPVDVKKIGVTGHSFQGKFALITMAYEPRIAIAFPSCSGSLGVVQTRRHWGQDLESSASSSTEYSWMSGNIFKWVGPHASSPNGYLPRKSEDMTVDGHSLLALCAPRPVFINGGVETGDSWQDPYGATISARDASFAWEIQGYKGLIIGDRDKSLDVSKINGPDNIKAIVNKPYIDGRIGYRAHGAPDGHTQPTADWNAFWDFAKKNLIDKQDIPLVYRVENTGAGLPKPNFLAFENLPSIEQLPDPFAWADGSGRSTNIADWSKRRNEIKDIIEHYEIGEKPAVSREQVTATLSGTTLTVKVTRTVNGTEQSINVTATGVTIPEGDGPFPIVIGMGGAPNAAVYNGKAIARMSFNPSATNVSSQNENYLNQAISKLYPEYSEMGFYAAASWGVSRLIDGIEIALADKIDVNRIAVTGCSYAGKMALYAGAFDERIALTIPQESGGGGIASWRVSETLGGVENLSNTNYTWFLNDLKKFSGTKPSYKLPYDHHELLAMVAPRALFVIGNSTHTWLGEESGYVTSRATEEIYKTLGIGDRFGFSFIGDHAHCSTLGTYSLNDKSGSNGQLEELSAFVDRFLLGQENVETNIHTQDYFGEVDYQRWYNWWGTNNSTLDQIDPALLRSIYLEAENATVGANWTILEKDSIIKAGGKNDGTGGTDYMIPVGSASRRAYVLSPQTVGTSSVSANADDHISFTFTIADRPGNYKVYARLNAKTSDDDSVWAKMDNGDNPQVNGLATTGWEWKIIGGYTLAVGEHTFTIAGRENGLSIDKLVITNNPFAPEGFGGDASNLPPNTCSQSFDVVPPKVGVTRTVDENQMLCQLGINFPVMDKKYEYETYIQPRFEEFGSPVRFEPTNAAEPNGGWRRVNTNETSVVAPNFAGTPLERTGGGLWDNYVHSWEPAGDYLTGSKFYKPLALHDLTGLTVADWPARRAKIFEEVQKIWGTIPAEAADLNIDWVKGTPTESKVTVDGVDYPYTQYTLTGTITRKDGWNDIRTMPRLSFTVRIPTGLVGTKKSGVIVQFGGGTGFNNNFLPKGIGTGGFTQGNLQPDGGATSPFNSHLIGLVSKGNWRKPTDWGALVAWSWGISRFIDYLESAANQDIDPKKVGIEGHSRNGKATIVAMAYDQRVAIAFPSSGGALGTAQSRRHWGQELGNCAWDQEYHWMAGNFLSYIGVHASSIDGYMPRKVIDMPVDAESLVALCAPRPLFIGCGGGNGIGSDDTWQDPYGMYLTAVAASPVYEFLGKKGLTMNDTRTFYAGTANEVTILAPVANSNDYYGGDLAFRTHSGGHTDSQNFPAFAEFVDRYFNENPTTGLDVISGTKKATLYPNPVAANEIITIDVPIAVDRLDGAVIDVYSLVGTKINSVEVTRSATTINVGRNTGIFFYVFKTKDGFKKEFKVTVK